MPSYSDGHPFYFSSKQVLHIIKMGIIRSGNPSRLVKIRQHQRGGCLFTMGRVITENIEYSHYIALVIKSEKGTPLLHLSCYNRSVV